MPAVTWHGKTVKTGDGNRAGWAWPPPQVSVRAARTDGFVQLVPELPKMPRFPWMGVLLHTLGVRTWRGVLTYRLTAVKIRKIIPDQFHEFLNLHYLLLKIEYPGHMTNTCLFSVIRRRWYGAPRLDPAVGCLRVAPATA